MINVWDLTLVVSWLITILFLHFSILPIIRVYLEKVAVPLSFSLSLLLYTLMSYWIALLHLPVQLALIPFLCGAGYTGYLSSRKGGISALIAKFSPQSSEWRYYALFTVVFLAMLVLRVYSPDISSAEKFMDHGFIASMMRMPVIPPLDPWFSGGDLSVYYYLGHWMLAVLGITAGVPSSFLFTLALPTIAALAAVNMYGVGHLLLPRFRLLPVLFLFLMNPAFVQLAIVGTEWGKLLWDSTRVIDGTINEYPLFSFIFGDVHAHVLGFFPQTTLILLIILAITCWKEMNPVSRLILILSTGLTLGCIPPTNSWDILVQAPLILLTGVVLFFNSGEASVRPEIHVSLCSRMARIIPGMNDIGPEQSLLKHFSPGRGAILYILLVPVTGILCYLPFYVMMKAQGIGGIGLVTSPTSLPQFLLVNGWFVAILAISLVPVFRKAPWLLFIAIPFLITGYYAAAIPAVLLGAVLTRRQGAVDLLAGTALMILILCELLYIRDNMGEQYFRMNTVFKFYITAWLLFSAAVAGMLGKLLLPLKDRPYCISRVAEVSIVLILLLLLIIPALVTATHAGSHTPTFDGLSWLSVSHPDDLTAVRWLRSQEGNRTLVEAVDGDYGYESRISAFTGIPTLLGWPFHETMWRNNTPRDWYAQRTMAVRTIYEDPSVCKSLLKQYDIDLLYVGPTEREGYNISLPKSGLIPVYQHGPVVIYQLS